MAVYECDECGDVELLYTGFRIASNPPKIEHECSRCKRKFYLKEKYPEIRYKRV